MSDKDFSKKRDRTTTQRIHIRNEVSYRNPFDSNGENPYYQSSPTLVSGVYGKHRFRAVMSFGVTPRAYIEVPKDMVSKVDTSVINRGITSVSQSVKGVGTVHSEVKKRWVGWAYDGPTDFSPISLQQAKGKKWTTAQILKDIKRVIDTL